MPGSPHTKPLRARGATAKVLLAPVISGVLLLQGFIGLAATASETTKLPITSSEDAALHGIAEDARSIRNALRSPVASDPTELAVPPSATSRLSAVAERALGLPNSSRLGPLLIHLHHSAKLLADSPLVDDASTKMNTRPWLVRVLNIAEGDPRFAALRAHARLEIALLDEAAGDTPAALIGARTAAFEGANAEHDDTLYRARWLIGRIHRAEGNQTAALAAYREAVATLEGMKADIVAQAQSDALSFRREVEPVYRGLVDLLLTQSASAKVEDEQRLLHEAREAIERSREAELRDYFRDECLVSPDESRTDSIPGSVLVHPIRLDDRIEIIVGRQGRLSRHPTAISPEDMEALTKKFRRNLEQRMTRRYVRSAESLYTALIQPIESRLRESPVEALVFFPGEQLRQIPIAALRNPETKRFLIQDYPVAVAPSLALIDPQPLDPGQTLLLAAGLTEAVQGFSALPNVGQEIESARAFFPGTSFIDRDFRTSALEQSIQSVPYRVIHIASHAQFSSDPSDSFLLTWDHRLPLARLAELLGSTRFRSDDPIDLLVLSACETATGDDRSTLGLAGAAIQMGARSVVGSLWSVNDEASARLMTHFYRALSKPGMSRAEALQIAQIAMLEQDAYAHPVDWAAFLLISSWL